VQKQKHFLWNFGRVSWRSTTICWKSPNPNLVAITALRFSLKFCRAATLTLLLALDFNEINDPSGLAQDATQWQFLSMRAMKEVSHSV
jgi:hypothetical protein